MRICHQSSWCPPERLVTAAPVAMGVEKVGRSGREISWGLLSLQDRLSSRGWQRAELGEGLHKTFVLTATPFLEN